MAHIAVTTSFQSFASLGPNRKYALHSTTDCQVMLVCGVDTSDTTDGVPILDKDGKPLVLSNDSPKVETAHVVDPSVAVKYVVLSGTVTGSVWCDADAAQGTVALTAYTPNDATDYDGTITTMAGAADELAGRVKDLEVSNETAQYTIPINIASAVVAATGAPLAVFANGASTVPGIELTNSKAVSVRWNNHATPGAIAVTTPMPQDLDDTADVVIHALVSKVGATVGDATKLTIGAFEQVVGALHDADSDMGGDSDAVVGDATSRTVSELTLALTGANIHPSPQSITLTVKPKDGTLGTDDFCLHAMWFEAKRKPLTS